MSYFKRIQLLPLGSYEYHGEKLPPETDTTIAVQVAKSLAPAVAQKFAGEVVVLPPLAYGLALEHAGRPTTAYVLHCTFYNFLKEIASTVCQPCDLIVFVNGHGGNSQTLGALEGEFNSTFQDRKAFFPPLFSGPVKSLCEQLFGENDAHAGSVEASLIAHYHQTPARQYTVELSPRVRGSMRFFRSAEIAPAGVIKRDPIVIADPQKGSRVHDQIVSTAAASIIDLVDSLSSVINRNGS